MKLSVSSFQEVCPQGMEKQSPKAKAEHFRSLLLKGVVGRQVGSLFFLGRKKT